ncbi:MAG: molybdopterin-dependent oxidoreductase [Dehalococcoidales bacterium]|nr:molybdopterin-dependent oxidoreductase [Dehalococcoidales bacterium]
MSIETIVRTACPAHCGNNACGILAHVCEGKVVKLEPSPFPDNYYMRICQKGLSATQLTYHPDRLQYPMKRAGERGQGKWQRVSWDEALDYIAAKLKDIAGKYGSRSVAWAIGGPGTGTVKFGAYTRFAGCFQGTRVSMWGYGDAAEPCGAKPTYGVNRLPPFLSSFDEPKLNILWGTNPTESNPFQIRPVLDDKMKGVKMVVIDPVYTITASKADEYVPIRIGTDAALALGMMHQVLQDRMEDRDFLLRYTVAPYLIRQDNGRYLRERDLISNGGDAYLVWDSAAGKAVAVDSMKSPALDGLYQAGNIACKTAFQMLEELIQEYPPSRASEITGVPAEQIVRLARAYATDKPAAIYVNNGMSRTYHGDLTFRAVGTLAALTGNVKLPGPGGHREVEYNWGPFLKPRADQPSYTRMGVMNLYNAIEKGEPYPVRAAWFAFTNFVNQCTNNRRIVERLFPKLELIVMTEMFMTPSTKYADIVLPVGSFLEFTDMVNGPHPYIQLQRQVIPPLYEAKSDVQILRELAPRLGFGEFFKSEEEFVELLLASGDSSVKGITLETLKKGPAKLNSPPVIEARPAKASFKTPTGRIEFYLEKLVSLGEGLPVHKEPVESPLSPLAEKYPLSMVCVHSKFHVHSSFQKSPWMREQDPEPLLEMNRADADSRRIKDADLVEVFNDRGTVKLKVRLNEAIQPGVVNLTHGWWPEEFIEGDLNLITNDYINPAQNITFEPNMPMNDNLVEVRKA